MIHPDKKPLVSIIIPCYNHQDFVQECLQSVIDQEYKNIELIIIDDGSKDNSVQKIKEMYERCEQRFVRFEFRHRENQGLCSTLNEAIKWCNGNFVSFLASDDTILKEKILIQTKYLLKNEKCGGVFGGILMSQSNGKKTKVKEKNSYDFKNILFHNYELPAPTNLLRTDVLKKIGDIPTELIIEDWYLWLKITEQGFTLDYLNKAFAVYRRHDDNTSNQYANMMKGRLDVLKYFSDHKNYNTALANAHLVAANDWLSSDKKRSLEEYKKYLSLYPKIYNSFFKKKSLKYLIKFLIN